MNADHASNRPKLIASIASAICVIISMLLITGCSSSGKAAATVNGVDIPESKITDYVQSVRESMGYTDEDSWGQYLAQSGLTPEMLREQMIEGYVNNEILRQYLEDEGIKISEDEVDEQYEQTKSQYPDESSWQAALKSQGMTEDMLKENIRLSLMQDALQEQLGIEPSEEELIATATEYSTYMNGARRYSQILFGTDEQESAQQVLDSIRSGEISFEEAASQYSEDDATAENGGDLGWDTLNSAMTSFTGGLEGLQNGDVGDLVITDDGIRILMQTDYFAFPSELTSMEQLPEEFRDAVSQVASDSAMNDAISQWLEERIAASDIVRNDMPDGLPYYVDMSKYQSTSSDLDMSSLSGMGSAQQ